MTSGGKAGGGNARRRGKSPAVRVALVAAFLLLGPAMFVVSRARALGLAYTHVHLGDSAASVVATMGRPQQQAGEGAPGGAMQYVYSAWPWPHQWIVNLRDGKVIGKSEISR
ncbi:MAG TPA: hypothetical protein VMT29_10280 [Steroidobacteraceae bacterium]|nr:hypothetical protein [Steroidobacteraceae bacterium]